MLAVSITLGFKQLCVFVLVLTGHQVESGTVEIFLSLNNTVRVLNEVLINDKIPLSRPQHWNFSKLSGNCETEKVAAGVLTLAADYKVNEIYNLAGFNIVFLYSHHESFANYRGFIRKKIPAAFEKMAKDDFLGVAIAGTVKIEDGYTSESYAVIVIMRRSNFLVKLGNPVISISAIRKGICIIHSKENLVTLKEDKNITLENELVNGELYALNATSSAHCGTNSLDEIAYAWVILGNNDQLALNIDNSNKDKAIHEERQSYAFFYLKNKKGKLTIATLFCNQPLSSNDENLYHPIENSEGAWAEQGLKVLEMKPFIGKATNTRFVDNSVYLANEYAQAVSFGIINNPHIFKEIQLIHLPFLTVILSSHVTTVSWSAFIDITIEKNLSNLKKNRITGVGVDGLRFKGEDSNTYTFGVIVIAMECPLTQALGESGIYISVKATLVALEAKMRCASITETVAFNLPIFPIGKGVYSRSADDDVQMEDWLAENNISDLFHTDKQNELTSYAFAQSKDGNNTVVAKISDTITDSKEMLFSISNFVVKHDNLLVEAKDGVEYLRRKHFINPILDPLMSATGLAKNLVNRQYAYRKSLVNLDDTMPFSPYTVAQALENANVDISVASIAISVNEKENFGNIFCSKLDQLHNLDPISPDNNSTHVKGFSIYEDAVTEIALRVLKNSAEIAGKIDYWIEIALVRGKIEERQDWKYNIYNDMFVDTKLENVAKVKINELRKANAQRNSRSCLKLEDSASAGPAEKLVESQGAYRISGRKDQAENPFKPYMDAQAGNNNKAIIVASVVVAVAFGGSFEECFLLELKSSAISGKRKGFDIYSKHLVAVAVKVLEASANAYNSIKYYLVEIALEKRFQLVSASQLEKAKGELKPSAGKPSEKGHAPTGDKAPRQEDTGSSVLGPGPRASLQDASNKSTSDFSPESDDAQKPNMPEMKSFAETETTPPKDKIDTNGDIYGLRENLEAQKQFVNPPDSIACDIDVDPKIADRVQQTPEAKPIDSAVPESRNKDSSQVSTSPQEDFQTGDDAVSRAATTPVNPENSHLEHNSMAAPLGVPIPENEGQTNFVPQVSTGNVSITTASPSVNAEETPQLTQDYDTSPLITHVPAGYRSKVHPEGEPLNDSGYGDRLTKPTWNPDQDKTKFDTNGNVYRIYT